MNIGIKTTNYKYIIPIDIVSTGFKREGYKCKKCGCVLFGYDAPWWKVAPIKLKWQLASKWIGEHWVHSPNCFTIKLRMWNQGDAENERAIMEKRTKVRSRHGP